MRYFYDTEFLEDGNTIALISIGIVAEDGREYYAVNSEVDDSNGDHSLGRRISRHRWLMKNVVPSLPLRTPPSKYLGGTGGYQPPHLDSRDARVKPRWVIANEVRDFIYGGVTADGFLVDMDGEARKHELWAYYGAYDHVALCQLWGTMMQLPEGVPMFTHELMQLWHDAGEPEPEKPLHDNEHDALVDARWNRDLWLVCTARLASGESER